MNETFIFGGKIGKNLNAFLYQRVKLRLPRDMWSLRFCENEVAVFSCNWLWSKQGQYRICTMNLLLFWKCVRAGNIVTQEVQNVWIFTYINCRFVNYPVEWDLSEFIYGAIVRTLNPGPFRILSQLIMEE